MVLTRDKILEEIKRGNIKIEPFTHSNIGPASVDLRLSNKFRVFKKQRKPFDVKDEVKFEDITELIEVDHNKPLLLEPGQVVLGITEERITLAPNIAGWIEGRSRFARIGLGIHITSGFAQPGISNQQVLEIANLGPNTLALYPGTKICQFIFQRCEGEASYRGKFQGQTTP